MEKAKSLVAIRKNLQIGKPCNHKICKSKRATYMRFESGKPILKWQLLVVEVSKKSIKKKEVN